MCHGAHYFENVHIIMCAYYLIETCDYYTPSRIKRQQEAGFEEGGLWVTPYTVNEKTQKRIKKRLNTS